MKILIIGGYGVFGGRLAELLSDIDTLEILVGGRSFERAQEFCAAYRGAAVVRRFPYIRRARARASASCQFFISLWTMTRTRNIPKRGF